MRSRACGSHILRVSSGLRETAGWSQHHCLTASQAHVVSTALQNAPVTSGISLEHELIRHDCLLALKSLI
jgi:hypothetical protein